MGHWVWGLGSGLTIHILALLPVPGELLIIT